MTAEVIGEHVDNQNGDVLSTARRADASLMLWPCRRLSDAVDVFVQHAVSMMMSYRYGQYADDLKMS